MVLVEVMHISISSEARFVTLLLKVYPRSAVASIEVPTEKNGVPASNSISGPKDKVTSPSLSLESVAENAQLSQTVCPSSI